MTISRRPSDEGFAVSKEEQRSGSNLNERACQYSGRWAGKLLGLAGGQRAVK